MSNVQRRTLLALAALAALLVAAACNSGRSLFATSLDIMPDTASPGDVVTFSFYLQAIPAHSLRITATVNGTSVVSGDFQGFHDGIFEINLGDAADLITRFGTGQHAGQVEVRSLEDGDIVYTPPVGFVLVP